MVRNYDAKLRADGFQVKPETDEPMKSSSTSKKLFFCESTGVN